jgi:hypothetical protein
MQASSCCLICLQHAHLSLPGFADPLRLLDGMVQIATAAGAPPYTHPAHPPPQVVA